MMVQTEKVMKTRVVDVSYTCFLFAQFGGGEEGDGAEYG